MEQTVEQIIAERSYSSLNEKERELVAELCANEQEFNHMKQFFMGMTAMGTAASYEPSAAVKSSLDSVFAAKHGGIGARLTPRQPAPVKTIPFHQQTWVRVAAGVVLIAGVFSIWQLTDQTVDRREATPQLAKAETTTQQNETIVQSDAATETQQGVRYSPPAINGSYSAESSPAEVSYSMAAPLPEQEADDVIPMTDRGVSKTTSAADTDSYVTMGNLAGVTPGRQADLYPNGQKKDVPAKSSMASSVASSSEDLLSYLVPAF